MCCNRCCCRGCGSNQNDWDNDWWPVWDRVQVRDGGLTAPALTTDTEWD